MLTPKANTVDVNATLALKADKTYVDGQLALKADQSTTYTQNEVINLLKHPTITSATDLTVNTIITNSVETQAGTTYLQLRRISEIWHNIICTGIINKS